MVSKGSALFALLATVGTVAAYPTEDLVQQLWQWSDISWGLYSGYSQIPGTSKSLHYVAALSQQNKTTDPVIVWFNGGPGCSSMLGFLQEHGPYSLADGEQTFMKNPQSWNKEANVIYIESPAGVGYSTCGKPEECQQWNDFNTADDNLQAFLGVMNKFPELQSKDLYISGESYAGIYVPRLVERIDWYIGNCTQNKSCSFIPNLKGFMVGNGVTDYRFDNGDRVLEMAYWFGILQTSTYNGWMANNCSTTTQNLSDICVQFYNEFESSMENINIYDAFGICWQNQTSVNDRPSLYSPSTSVLKNLFRTGVDHKQLKNYFSAADYTPFLASSHPKLKLIPPCTYAKPTLAYLNNSTVRAQLNIPQSVQPWDLCNEQINTNYVKYPGGSIEIYRNLKDKYKILKYSGDTDMAVSTYGTKGWIENEDWEITQDWKQYFVGGQVGGYVETRNNGKFTFATIHGAGHMAPQWRPEFTYHTVFNWIKGQPI